jgi:hypothetical protein
MDYQRAQTAIDRLVKARGVFTEDFSQFTLVLRAVLTADQWSSLQNRRGGRGREGGKGQRPDGRGRNSGSAVGSGPGR